MRFAIILLLLPAVLLLQLGTWTETEEGKLIEVFKEAIPILTNQQIKAILICLKRECAVSCGESRFRHCVLTTIKTDPRMARIKAAAKSDGWDRLMRFLGVYWD
ncbi:unnamed protein product, partial [Mesorhabditis spiculigera]